MDCIKKQFEILGIKHLSDTVVEEEMPLQHHPNHKYQRGNRHFPNATPTGNRKQHLYQPQRNLHRHRRDQLLPGDAGMNDDKETQPLPQHRPTRNHRDGSGISKIDSEQYFHNPFYYRAHRNSANNRFKGGGGGDSETLHNADADEPINLDSDISQFHIPRPPMGPHRNINNNSNKPNNDDDDPYKHQRSYHHDESPPPPPPPPRGRDRGPRRNTNTNDNPWPLPRPPLSRNNSNQHPQQRPQPTLKTHRNTTSAAPSSPLILTRRRAATVASSPAPPAPRLRLFHLPLPPRPPPLRIPLPAPTTTVDGGSTVVRGPRRDVWRGGNSDSRVGDEAYAAPPGGSMDGSACGGYDGDQGWYEGCGYEYVGAGDIDDDGGDEGERGRESMPLWSSGWGYEYVSAGDVHDVGGGLSPAAGGGGGEGERGKEVPPWRPEWEVSRSIRPISDGGIVVSDVAPGRRGRGSFDYAKAARARRKGERMSLEATAAAAGHQAAATGGGVSDEHDQVDRGASSLRRGRVGLASLASGGATGWEPKPVEPCPFDGRREDIGRLDVSRRYSPRRMVDRTLRLSAMNGDRTIGGGEQRGFEGDDDDHHARDKRQHHRKKHSDSNRTSTPSARPKGPDPPSTAGALSTIRAPPTPSEVAGCALSTAAVGLCATGMKKVVSQAIRWEVEKQVQERLWEERMERKRRRERKRDEKEKKWRERDRLEMEAIVAGSANGRPGFARRLSDRVPQRFRRAMSGPCGPCGPSVPSHISERTDEDWLPSGKMVGTGWGEDDGIVEGFRVGKGGEIDPDPRRGRRRGWSRSCTPERPYAQWSKRSEEQWRRGGDAWNPLSPRKPLEKARVTHKASSHLASDVDKSEVAAIITSPIDAFSVQVR